MHSPPQLTNPGGQTSAHVPLLQTRPAPHASPALPPSTPQPSVAPQWFELVFGSMQVPLQLTKLLGQESEHSPPLQTCPGSHTSPGLPWPSTPQPSVAPQ